MSNRLTDAEIKNLMDCCDRRRSNAFHGIETSVAVLDKLLREVADARRAAGQVQAPPVAAGAPSQALTAEEAPPEGTT